jgi:hypothetical protein
MKRSLLRSLVAACSLASSGCAIVDQFGDRAVDYNIEGKKARNQFLLLNIIRSAYHKPMQFSVLTTVTGTATVSGGLSAVLPLGGPESGFQINASPSLLSGGPTFTVANQVDKEFYQGILTPVEKQTIDQLFQAGYPKQLVLTLLVSKISLQRADETKRGRHEFLNQPFGHFADFKKVIGELVNEGITTKRSDATDDIGPPLTSAQAGQMDGISKLTAQGLNLNRTKKFGKSTTSFAYQISKSEVNYRFCFDTMASAVRPSEALHARLLDRIGQSAIDALACDKEEDNAEEPPCGNKTYFVQHRWCTKAGKTKHADALEFTLRSTSSVIYCPGEISRGELKLVDDPRFVAPTLLFRRESGPDEVDILFNLGRETGDPTLTVG